MLHFRGNVQEVTLVPSGGGVFEVTVEGEKIFSKKELDRFPIGEEVSEIIDQKGLLQRAPE